MRMQITRPSITQWTLVELISLGEIGNTSGGSYQQFTPRFQSKLFEIVVLRVNSNVLGMITFFFFSLYLTSTKNVFVGNPAIWREYRSALLALDNHRGIGLSTSCGDRACHAGDFCKSQIPACHILSANTIQNLLRRKCPYPRSAVVGSGHVSMHS